MAYENQIKCIVCGISIPDVPEDATSEELLCESCYERLGYLDKYPRVGDYWIVSNQYLPDGFGRAASTYYYIVDSEGRIFHHKDKKWRIKKLKDITTFYFKSEDEARRYIEEEM